MIGLFGVLTVLAPSLGKLQEGSPTPLRPSGNPSGWDDKKAFDDMVLVFVSSHHSTSTKHLEVWVAFPSPFEQDDSVSFAIHLSRICCAKMSSHEAKVGDLGSEKTLGP